MHYLKRLVQVPTVGYIQIFSYALKKSERNWSRLMITATVDKKCSKRWNEPKWLIWTFHFLEYPKLDLEYHLVPLCLQVWNWYVPYGVILLSQNSASVHRYTRSSYLSKAPSLIVLQAMVFCLLRAVFIESLSWLCSGVDILMQHSTGTGCTICAILMESWGVTIRTFIVDRHLFL